MFKPHMMQVTQLQPFIDGLAAVIGRPSGGKVAIALKGTVADKMNSPLQGVAGVTPLSTTQETAYDLTLVIEYTPTTTEAPNTGLTDAAANLAA